MSPPVITIDGPSASGKGTVAERVAEALGFHYLESGALYRLVALCALQRDRAPDDAAALAGDARALDVTFRGGRVTLDGRDVTTELRAEACGNLASRIAAIAAVREALLERQRAFRRAPGLVTDGRDMGTVVFPDAPLKVYLTASVAVRAERRYKQLKEKGLGANLATLSRDLAARDERDSNRSLAPLVPAPDAVTVDTSDMTIDGVVGLILARWREISAG